MSDWGAPDSEVAQAWSTQITQRPKSEQAQSSAYIQKLEKRLSSLPRDTPSSSQSAGSSNDAAAQDGEAVALLATTDSAYDDSLLLSGNAGASGAQASGSPAEMGEEQMVRRLLQLGSIQCTQAASSIRSSCVRAWADCVGLVDVCRSMRSTPSLSSSTAATPLPLTTPTAAGGGSGAVEATPQTTESSSGSSTNMASASGLARRAPVHIAQAYESASASVRRFWASPATQRGLACLVPLLLHLLWLIPQSLHLLLVLWKCLVLSVWLACLAGPCAAWRAMDQDQRATNALGAATAALQRSMRTTPAGRAVLAAARWFWSRLHRLSLQVAYAVRHVIRQLQRRRAAATGGADYTSQQEGSSSSSGGGDARSRGGADSWWRTSSTDAAGQDLPHQLLVEEEDEQQQQSSISVRV